MAPRSIILILALAWFVPPAATRAGQADSQPAAPADPIQRWSAQAETSAATLGPFHNAVLLTALAEAHLRQARAPEHYLQEAARVALQIDSPLPQADCLADIAAEYVQAGQGDQALTLVAKIDSPTLKVRALCRLAQAHRQVMDLDAMEKAFDQAKRSACAAADPGQRAGALLDLAAAQVKAGRTVESAQTVLLAQQEAAQIGADPPEPLPAGQAEPADRSDSRTSLLRLVALAWARAGQADRACEAARLAGIPPGMRPEDLRSVLPRFHQVTLLPQIALIQFERGDRDGAAASLDKAENYTASITYDDDAVPGLHRSELYCGVAQGYIQTGDLESALRCLGKARESASGTKLAWQRHATAVMFAQAQDFNAALATASEIAGPTTAAQNDWLREQAFCYADLAELQFQAAQTQRARRCVDLALATARRCPAASTCDALTRVAFVLLDARDVPAGRKVLDESIQALAGLDALTRDHLARRLAEGLARCDDLPAARRLIARYVAPQAQWEALALLNVVQAERIKTMLKAGKIDQARTLADEQARTSRDLTGIAQAFLEAGQPVEAMRYLERTILTDQQWWPAADLFRQVAAALSAAGKVAEIDAWIARLNRPAIRAYVCLGAVQGCRP